MLLADHISEKPGIPGERCRQGNARQGCCRVAVQFSQGPLQTKDSYRQSTMISLHNTSPSENNAYAVESLLADRIHYSALRP